MLARLRLGCIGAALIVGLGLVVFWGPISRRMMDWTFERTAEQVAEALPVAEREEAEALCARLWTNLRAHGVPPEHTERFGRFRKAAFAMLEDDDVTEEEARAFVVRVEDVLREMYPAP